MLYPNLLNAALKQEREGFIRYDRMWRREVETYARRLVELGSYTAAEIREISGAARRPTGALVSEEIGRHGSIIVPFERSWGTHEEARRWALASLEGRVTFAADGSQLLPGREISMPVAGVQVAWFENPHTRQGVYEKNARFVVITPGELFETLDGRTNAETIVGFRRFRLETEVIAEFLKRRKGWKERGERAPVAFFDGTLMVSLALPKTRVQQQYIQTIVDLVKLSRATRVPLVGFIDQSYASDLVRLLDMMEERRSPPPVSRDGHAFFDAQTLRFQVDEHVALLANWGDRTAFCYCLREGLSDAFIDDAGAPLIGFTYLQTTGDCLPARLDIPAWIYEDGLIDEVVDSVRAECICGLGYPYAIETADDAAVITARDRERFLRAIQEFADENGFPFRVSRKAASKMRRR